MPRAGAGTHPLLIVAGIYMGGILGCQGAHSPDMTATAPHVDFSPRYQISPEVPCVGDAVSVKGTGFPAHGMVGVRLLPQVAPTGAGGKTPMPPAAASAGLGAVTADALGNWSLSFVLPGEMPIGLFGLGGSIAIVPGGRYIIAVDFGGTPGTQTVSGQSFTVCP